MLLVLGIPAEAQQPKKIPRIGVLRPDSPQRRHTRHSGKGCVISVMSKPKTSSWNFAMVEPRPSGSPISLLSWSVLRLM
jgi:hypothetical protein